jgi:hypothetical protein
MHVLLCEHIPISRKTSLIRKLEDVSRHPARVTAR